MASVNFQETATFNDLLKIIPLVGSQQTFVIQSSPGCGKSSLHHAIEEVLGSAEYDHIYVDCPTCDTADVFMRIPVHETKDLEAYIGAIFKRNSGKKKVIMLDEFMKSPKMLQVIWTRLMLEHYIGDWQLPEGSIVFATSNNQADGLGDSMLAHSGNRVTITRMQKPTALQWCAWASGKGISPILQAWVAMNPRVMADYMDGGQDDNPYIFNPKKPQLSFVSPRSIAKCDPFIRNRSSIGETLTKTMLAGTIGKSGAESLAAFLMLEKELIAIKDVIKDPEGSPVPSKPAALFMMMFNAVETIETQDDLSSFMRYMARVTSSEVRAVFYTMLLANKKTVRIAKNNADVSAWSKENYELLI